MNIRAEPGISLRKYERILALLFVLTLPFVNPWVRGDGVGYYAYVRSLLIHGDLHFESEWLAGNPSFLMNRVDALGQLKPDQYTPTGYISNHFTVGPAILWAPFLVIAHSLVLFVDRMGLNIPADGYSWPYTTAMAAATALYGFLGLFLSFRLARNYVSERWAFWGTLGIWFASSLPVYMYLNPSWSHAHSAFAVSLFLWYWHRTRNQRDYAQWAVLGIVSGLMLDIYYPNGVFLLVPLLESLTQYWRNWNSRARCWPAVWRLLTANVLYVATTATAFLPTLITRQIIYGSPFQSGYYPLRGWQWTAPALWAVLFSSNHGLLTWTPILVPALIGLFWLRRCDLPLAGALGLVFLSYYYLIASYPTWHGISSFGNRFFVSLTPIFVLGLAACFEVSSQELGKASAAVPALVMALIVWNAGFIFQWGTKMVPNRDPISWRAMIRNQVAVVPGRLFGAGKGYILRRHSVMNVIEQEDVRQLAQKAPKPSK